MSTLVPAVVEETLKMLEKAMVTVPVAPDPFLIQILLPLTRGDGVDSVIVILVAPLAVKIIGVNGEAKVEDTVTVEVV